MADVFDSVAMSSNAAPTSVAPPTGGDVFDQAASGLSTKPSGTGDVFDQIPSGDTFDQAANQHGILSSLKATVEGPGTFFGTSIPGDTWSNLVEHPIDYFHNVFPHAVDLASKPFVKVENAESDEFKQNHPIITGASQFASGLTTPTNVAIAGVVGPAAKGFTEGGELLTGLSKAAMKAVPALASLGFSYQAIKQGYDQLPQVKDALDRGDTSEAERLMTIAALSGGVGLLAGFHGATGLHDVVSESGAEPGKVTSATQQKDYADAIHDYQARQQIGSAQAEQFRKEGQSAVPEEEKREALTNYREAGGNKELLAARAAMAAEGKGRVASLAAAPEAEHVYDAATKTIAPVPAGSAEIALSQLHVYDPKSGTTELWDPKTGKTYPLGSEPGANYVYRSRDVGEKGVPSESHSQATTSADEARRYVESRGKVTGQPQELVRVDLNKLEPSEYETKPGPNGNDWVKFKKDIPESAVEAVPGESDQGPLVPFGPAATSSQIAREQFRAGLAEKLASPEAQERLKGFAKGYEAAQNLTPEELAVEQKGAQLLADRKAQLQEVGLLPKSSNVSNYVPHSWTDVPVEEDADVERNRPSGEGMVHGNRDFLKVRVVPSYHAGEMAGFSPTSKDFVALTSDYLRDTTNILAQKHLVNDLEMGRTNSGAPLVVAGGFMTPSGEIIPEYPQDLGLSDTAVKNLSATGKLDELLKSGRVYTRPGRDGLPNFFMKTSDYVPTELTTTQLMNRPLSANMQEHFGITDKPWSLPDDAARAVNEKRILDLQSKGVLYPKRDVDGNVTGLYETASIPVRVPLYAHPDVAEHLNNSISEYRPGKVIRGALALSSNVKQALLSLSPFHLVTEIGRNMASQGPLTGLVGSAADIYHTIFNPTETIDYNNLTPSQAAAIRDGLVASEVRPRSTSYTEEGLSAADSKALVNRAINAVTNPIEDAIKKVAKKTGFNDQLRKVGLSVDNLNLNLNQVFADKLFGAHGVIVRQKFGLYDYLKSRIADIMAEKHPEWSDQEIETASGREAAKMANDAFGGLNYTILGRSMKNQAALRALLLAPDFLESSGRNLADLAGPYGGPLLKNFIRFNVANYLAARAANYALHHKKGDDLAESIAATHPEVGFGVLSSDGKKVYSMRSQTADFLHFVQQPKEFIENRVNPVGRGIYTAVTGENAYGRKLPPMQRAEALIQPAMPITLQKYILPNRAVNEPTGLDKLLQGVGVSNYSYQTPAEQLAIQLAENRLEGKPVLTGQELLQQQLRLRAEDQLRDAYQAKDKAAIKAATQHLNDLVKQHLMSPRDLGRVLKDARESRLQSIFTTLAPTDALDVWDKMTTTEKQELAPALQRKYSRWLGDLQRDGKNIRSLDPDDKQTYDRFKIASGDVNRLRKPKVQ